MKKTNLLTLVACSLCSCSTTNNESLDSKESNSVLEESMPITSEELSSDNIIMSNKKVVLIGIDGAGHEINQTNTPTISAIFNEGATSSNVLTANPTISAQCWGSMLTGTIPSVTKFTNDSIASVRNTQFSTIFKKIKEQNSDAILASFCNWSPINYGIVEEDIGVYKATNSDDNMLTNMIINYLDNNNPDMLYVQFDSVDHAGHSFGYTSKEYYEALNNIDECVYQIYEKLYDLERLEDTLFIVTADHGGINKSHGGFSDAEKYVFFGAKGQNINNGIIGNMFVRDIPAIIAYFLKIDLDDSFDSYIPSNLFIDNLNPLSRTPNESFSCTKPTPDIDTLYKYTDKDALKLYLPFDENLVDVVGNHNVSSNGKVYYPNGLLSNSLNVSHEGYVSINDYKFNNQDFTISLDVHVNNKSGDPCLLSNSNWQNGNNDGFNISLRDSDIKFNVGANGTVREDVTLFYPLNSSFFNISITYSSDSNELRFYINHSLEYVLKMTHKVNFDSTLPINIGQDGTGLYSYGIDCLVDNLMIFDKALSNDEISKLKQYSDYSNNK